MLSIRGNDAHSYCDGLSRRSFLSAGVLGLSGLEERLTSGCAIRGTLSQFIGPGGCIISLLG